MKISFDKEEDRELAILVDNKVVYTTDHDELGWIGMDAVEKAVRDVAWALGVTVIE